MKIKHKTIKLLSILLSLTFMLSAVPFTASAAGGVEINESNFPDDRFRSYVSYSFDSNQDGVLIPAEILEAKEINVIHELYGERITTLKGIEYFTELTKLSCFNNNITSLDLSKNTKLTKLFCGRNRLTSLDISKNTLLSALYCYDNQLTSLDISKNPKLKDIELSKNADITDLDCRDNEYTAYCADTMKLDLTTLPGNFDVSKASGWTGGTVSGNILTVNSGTSRITYSYNIGYGKKETFTINIKKPGERIVADINYANFPGYDFKNFVEQYDLNNDDSLSVDECSAVTSMVIDCVGYGGVKGIEYFTELVNLDCHDANLYELDLSKNTKLAYLDCSDNYLSKLDLSCNTKLYSLKCDQNYLESLDLSKNTALTTLSCNYNNIEDINISNCVKLGSFGCSFNKISALDISRNFVLSSLDCSNNRLTSLDVSNNSKLSSIKSSANCTFASLSDKRTFDLSTLPGKFDVSKASSWTNGTVSGNTLTVAKDADIVTYTYDIGRNKKFTFSIDFKTAYPGDKIVVTYSFAKDIPDGVPCYQFECPYDSSLLEYESYENHWCIEPVLKAHPDENCIKCNASNFPGPAVKAGEKIISFTFNVLDTLYVREQDFTLEGLIMGNNDLDKQYDVSYIDYSVEHISQSREPEYGLGDINLDGVVTIADATLLQKHLANLTSLDEKQLAVADTNGDKTITIADATQIQKSIAGLAPSLG